MFRVCAVLLLSMNLGVAAWWVWHPVAHDARAPTTDPGIAALVMLSESEAPLPVREPELGVGAASEYSQCLSLGPFNTPADLRKAMNLLTPRVGRIQFREVAAVAVRGYRVYLPAAGTRAQALATARALAAHGVNDYYVVTAGDQQDTISLGLFRDLDNARARHDTIAALGYEPTIEARTEQLPQWWVDIAAPATMRWQEVLSGEGLQALPMPCE
jgi:hypothetical protein